MANERKYDVEVWGPVPPSVIDKFELSQQYDDETSTYRYLGVMKHHEWNALILLLADEGDGAGVFVKPTQQKINPYVVIDLTLAPDQDRQLVDDMLQHLFSIAKGEITDGYIKEWTQPAERYEGTYITWQPQENK